ncbi:MAG: glutathione S-transferase domain protein [Caulobacteraceae bacterium]|nr:glutathione S-transferase domain protein [Caulobacteraceae bacterium]
MKLYYTPGACSLAAPIALHEAGLRFDRVMVDLKAHTTEEGRDYTAINPKGYVPALEFDDGQVLTENVAILSWVADQDPALAAQGPMGRYRLLEMLGFLSSEVHKSFKPFFMPGSTEAEKAAAGEQIGKRLALVAANLEGDYLRGGFSVADAYLFVMLLWARQNGLPWPEPLPGWFARVEARPAVRLSLQHEGLA